MVNIWKKYGDYIREHDKSIREQGEYEKVLEERERRGFT